MGLKLLVYFFVTLTCIPGLCAFTLVPSQNPVAVGTNVTISVNNPPNPITFGSWLFGPSVLFIWFGENAVTGSGHKDGIGFNNDTYQLTLLSVTLNSSGTYVLESFKPNKISSAVTLDVQEPVSNVNAGVSMTNLVEFNDTVTFTCNASGTPLWFSWLNGSSAVTQGGRVQLSHNGRNLVISGVMRYDEGPFKCVVVNNISNEESGQMSLNISYGPGNLRITASPENIVYTSGSAISLSCSADTKPSASFYWMFNGNPLNVYNSTYNLLNTTPNTTGQYTCVAQNAATRRYESVSKTILVVDPITAVALNPSGSPVEGMPFNLSCNVVGPVNSIQWMKNGAYMFADDTITFFNGNKTLSFKKMALSDDGPYKCSASNAASNMSSQGYNLTVNYGPWNLTIEGPTMAQIGSNVTFRCSADSHPQSQFSWLHNGSKVADGQVFVTEALSRNNSGHYTCMAFNNITGMNSSASLQLTLKYPVTLATVNVGNQQPIFSQPFTLTCNASGDVELIQWMKNVTFLNPVNGITFSSDNSTLTFQNLSLNDDGDYKCEARNTFTTVTSQAYDLMVNYGPWNLTIEGPNMTEIGSNVTFRCSADSHPQSQFSWLHNGSKVADGQVYMTTVLSQNSNGNYTCMAINNITGMNSSTSLQFIAIDPLISVNLTADRLIALASQSLQLTCKVTGLFDKIYWLRNNQSFQPSNGIIFSADNTTVTFSSLQTANWGKYQCFARNTLKELASPQYDLVVIFGPQSVQIIVYPGIPPKMTCQALSQPKAVFHWINENNTVLGNESTIEVPMKYILGSNYTCVAKNPLTNVTVYTSQIINYPNAAVSVQASVVLTVLLALLFPVLKE